MKKTILSFFLGGLSGFLIVYALMNLSEIKLAGEITVISLIAITILLMAVGIPRLQKIKLLAKQSFNGIEEDEIEDRKYKLFADYSLCTNASFFLSLLALSLSFIITEYLILSLAAVILMTISLYLIHLQTHIMEVYNGRKVTDKMDATKSILDFADDGEKHVILDGLFKSQSLLNLFLIAAIALSTIYSISKEESQTFSIILMALTLLAVNSKYMLVVRNK